MTLLHDYERHLAPARERFAASSGVQAIQSTQDAAFLESFLLHFCALGSQMTAPVERWIHGAAERCANLGLSDLAHALSGHARAEAGHHLMMIADTKGLTVRWNTQRKPFVNAEKLLNQAPSLGVRQYCEVHEQNVLGETPYAQIAIEYEVEMLPLRYGELFVGHCVQVLGSDILACLSFVTQHIVLDAGHTKFNARAIAMLLELMPGCLPALVSAGTAILDAYAQFLADCVKLAEHDCRMARHSSTTRLTPLCWRVQPPLKDVREYEGRPLPDWLEDVSTLRGSVFFDGGRRPYFITDDGRFSDPDPLDLHAYHILAYDGPRLVGCVRVYPLTDDGPASVSEAIIGEQLFSEVLREQGARRADTVEIGRWVVHPAYRANGQPGTQLAAAAASLAAELGRRSRGKRQLVVCSAGTADHQDRMLARIGLTAISAAWPIRCDDFNDEVRVMYCTSADRLNGRFRRIMRKMADIAGISPACLSCGKAPPAHEPRFIARARSAA